jgi:alpha-L-rhamnosidase
MAGQVIRIRGAETLNDSLFPKPLEEGDKLSTKTAKGYRQIHIEPHVPQSLDFVNASVETVAGKVVSNWKKEAGTFTQEVTIPANTTATIALPFNGSENVIVYEGDSKIWENNTYVEGVSGIHEVTINNERLVVKTGSGDYRFGVE